MALAVWDVQPFLGQWVVVQLPLGSLEGALVAITRTALRLHPVMTVVQGTIEIADYSVVAPLDAVMAVRGCDRAVAERVVAEVAKAREATQGPAPPQPSAQWGNPL